MSTATFVTPSLLYIYLYTTFSHILLLYLGFFFPSFLNIFLCFFILQVSVPCTSLFKTVTVRCGHCTNLLPVNMRALLLPSPNQFHLGHSFFSPTHNLLVSYKLHSLSLFLILFVDTWFFVCFCSRRRCQTKFQISWWTSQTHQMSSPCLLGLFLMSFQGHRS